MTALVRLRAAGLKLTASGGRLLVEPRSALTDELRELIRANKSALLKELRAADNVRYRTSAAALEARRYRVERQLREHPELRVAFDAINAPLRPGPGEQVSVVLGVRCGEHILVGEITVPRERFQPALFLLTVDPSEKPAC